MIREEKEALMREIADCMTFEDLKEVVLLLVNMMPEEYVKEQAERRL
jgi:hypothetical protein